MTPEPEQGDPIDDLLDADDELPKPRTPTTPVTVAASTPRAEAPVAEVAQEAPSVELAPAASAPAAARRSGWMVWTLIVLVLLAAAVALGWYASQLRTEVAELKGQIESAKTQATGMQATASKVAQEVVPLVEEQATLAKLRAASGDREGAAYSLSLAKRYADMAERLAGGTPPASLAAAKALIAEAEQAAGTTKAEGQTSEPPAKGGG